MQAVIGPSDRLILASLLEAAAARIGDNSAIEVVDVGGKNNFASYQSLLDGLHTPWVAIADIDYLAQVGSPDVKSLFQTDRKRAADAILDDKKSIDRRTLIDSMGQAITDRDFGGLEALLTYIESRHQKLKVDRNEHEEAALMADFARLAATGVVILNGEIEDHLPNGVRDVADIVEFVSERNWIMKVPNAEKRRDLAEIACRVLGVEGVERTSLVESAKLAERVFPDPVVAAVRAEALR